MSQRSIQQAVAVIKTAILRSRYLAMRLANVEMLKLYYGIGCYVSENSRIGKWGSGAIAEISNLLQQELPGLRGFSETNIKSMRLFFEAWHIGDLSNRQSSIADLEAQKCSVAIRQLTTAEFNATALGDVVKDDALAFAAVPFTLHREIIRPRRVGEWCPTRGTSLRSIP